MANLMRWDPFREMMTLRSTIDRLFDDSFFGQRSEWQSVPWDLALDVLEESDEFVVKASLPGVNPDDLDITYTNNVLTIKGEIKQDKDVDEKHYHLRERRYGSFTRSISLPSSVKSDAISAQYEAGVLTLHLPKAEEAKPKRIAIQSSPKMLDAQATDVKRKK